MERGLRVVRMDSFGCHIKLSSSVYLLRYLQHPLCCNWRAYPTAIILRAGLWTPANNTLQIFGGICSSLDVGDSLFTFRRKPVDKNCKYGIEKFGNMS